MDRIDGGSLGAAESEWRNKVSVVVDEAGREYVVDGGGVLFSLEVRFTRRV